MKVLSEVETLQVTEEYPQVAIETKIFKGVHVFLYMVIMIIMLSLEDFAPPLDPSLPTERTV